VVLDGAGVAPPGVGLGSLGGATAAADGAPTGARAGADAGGAVSGEDPGPGDATFAAGEEVVADLAAGAEGVVEVVDEDARASGAATASADGATALALAPSTTAALTPPPATAMSMS